MPALISSGWRRSPAWTCPHQAEGAKSYVSPPGTNRLADGPVIGLIAVLVAAGVLALPARQAVAHGKVHCQDPGNPYLLFGRFDPIVEPGVEPSEHDHEFFGTRHILDPGQRANARYGDLVGTATTCEGGGNGDDSAAYWIPALFAGGQRKPAIRFIALLHLQPNLSTITVHQL